jgi:hypothetical protein
MPRYQPLPPGALRRYRLSERRSLVHVDQLASPDDSLVGAVSAFIHGLPDQLAARDLRVLIAAIATAYRQGRPVGLAMGPHLLKTGLQPYLVDLMERGIVSLVATNGATLIHDWELARAGVTSEDVSTAIEDGSFGMCEDTALGLARALQRVSAAEHRGLGRAVGEEILEGREAYPYARHSILAVAARLDLPVTVHVAIGTDVLHIHPEVDPALLGVGSHLDFRTLCACVADLEGGVWLNVGSAVILPEVFLKAVTLARNLGHPLREVTTANLDMLQHYRPRQNVTGRPVAGRGINLTGHHEIMVPLLWAGIRAALGEEC